MFFHQDIAEGSRNHPQKINAAWQAASEDMYKAQQQAGGLKSGFAQQARGAASGGYDPNNMGGQQGNSGAGQQGDNPNDNVTDVDYEEVK